MNVLIATIGCALAVAYFFWRDFKEERDSSNALWLPLIWVFLAGSRFVSYWIGQGGGGSYDEGNPLDAAVFGLLICAGLVVLSRRGGQWSDIAWRNKLVVGYFAYCLISVLWSDEPAIVLRRWVKDMGNPIMALVILTEPKPVQALGVVLRRFAYIALPVSVLFVRYYPDLGRTFHFGVPTYTGIGYQKNALGQLCLVTGLYFAWQVLADRATFKSWAFGRRLHLWLLIAMLFYLLDLSDSKTSLVSLVLAVAVFCCARLRFIEHQPKRLLGLILLVATAAFALETAFGLRDMTLAALDRNPSLTNRTDLWAILASLSVNPALGSGFMSFWAGDRLQMVWSLVGATVIQAHSGYLEQYLNLGYVGIAFLALMTSTAMLDARAQAGDEPTFSSMRLAIIVSAAAYNYTEAAFYGINNMWLLLLFALISAPQHVQQPTDEPVPRPDQQPLEVDRNDHDRPAAHTR